VTLLTCSICAWYRVNVAALLLCIVCIGLSGAGAGVKKSTTPLPTTGGGLDK